MAPPERVKPEYLKDKNFQSELMKLWSEIKKDQIYSQKLKIDQKSELLSAPQPSEAAPAQTNISQSQAQQQETFNLCEEMRVQLMKLQQEKTELRARLSQLMKLEDAKDFNKNKSLSTGPAQKSAEKGGFSLL